MISLEEIVSLLKERKQLQAPAVERMRQVRDAYNGDIALPMPELSKTEKSSVANLMALGIDQNARRIASTTPNMDFPPEKEGQSTSNKIAGRQRKAMFGIWGENGMRMQLYRRARWLVAYTMAPVVLRPDFDRKVPRWQLRDPLTTFPAATNDPDDMIPPDCIFTFSRGSAWVHYHYPRQWAQLRDDNDYSMGFELVEYVDDDETVLAILGTKKDLSPFNPEPAGMATVRELERIPNRAGCCLAVTPGRITLDRPQGQFDGILGMYQTQARLMALELLAVERGIFKEEWFVHRPNEMGAQIITVADGRQGIMGELKGGQIQEVSPDPSLVNLQAIDRMERAQRVTAGIPAEYGGESTTNVRTGRRGDAILSAVVDFPVQEAQEIFAEALQKENKIAIAIDKAYFGTEAKSFYVNWKGAKGKIDYVPNELWTSDENYVSYSHAGADVNGLVVGGGERIGMGTMSKKTFMKIDPMVDDPELEHERVIAEGLEMALMQSIQTQASQGAIPPHFVARMSQLVLSGSSLAEAIQKVQAEAQAAQAQQVPPGAPAGQPGIAQPGAGAEATINGPTPGSTNLADLLNKLRSPQQTVPSEQGGGPAPAPRQLARTPGGGQ